MEKCKDCLSYDVCKNVNGVFADSFTKRDNIEKQCEHFKDRSKIISLPCKVGDTVYDIYGLSYTVESIVFARCMNWIIHH